MFYADIHIYQFTIGKVFYTEKPCLTIETILEEVLILECMSSTTCVYAARVGYHVYIRVGYRVYQSLFWKKLLNFHPLCGGD